MRTSTYVHTCITLGLMSLVVVGLLAIHLKRDDKPTVLTYEEFQRIW